jgi:putative flippase GtrA
MPLRVGAGRVCGSGRFAEAYRFAIVGTLGFVVDAGLLAVLFHGFGLGHYVSRAVSFPAAITTTWLLNRSWTFSHRKRRSRKREYSIYFVVQSIGAGLNFLVYVLCVGTSPTLRAYPTLALAIGSLTAMVFNFVASRRFAFPGAPGSGPPADSI